MLLQIGTSGNPDCGFLFLEEGEIEKELEENFPHPEECKQIYRE
jgi:hypothetical protein